MFMTFKKGTDYFSILIQNMKLDQYKTEKQFKCNTRASHYNWPMDKSDFIMHGQCHQIVLKFGGPNSISFTQTDMYR